MDIYFTSSVLIGYDVIKALKEMISDELKLRGFACDVNIVEKYNLSDQYSPVNLWQTYKPSIIKELAETNHLVSSCIENADITFNDNVMHIIIENQLIYHKKEEEIVNYIISIFRDRCNIPIEIEIEYEKEKLSDREEQLRKEKQYEISRILSQTIKSDSNTDAQSNNSNDGTNNFKANNKTLDVETRNNEENNNIQRKKQTKSKSSTYNRTYNKNNYKSKYKNKSLPDDPNLIYGYNFDDEVVKVSEIESMKGYVTLDGQIFSVADKELRNGKILLTFNITDFTDSVTAKMFLSPEEYAELKDKIVNGKFIRLKGSLGIDDFSGELIVRYVSGIKLSEDKREPRMDLSMEKRVELHMHTNMSENDAITPVETLIDTAMRWGMKSMAITDHGVVNAFTNAFHYIRDNELDFKIIYGMEGYIVDDKQHIVFGNSKQSLNDTFVVFDLETTGLNSIKNQIIEIGAVKIHNGEVVDKFSEFVNPMIPIPYEVTNLTSITDKDVQNAESIDKVLPRFLEFVSDSVLVAHNAGFDMGFIKQKALDIGTRVENTCIDTMVLARTLLPTLRKVTLDSVCKELNISLENHHRAVDDANATAEMFVNFIPRLRDKNINNVNDINNIGLKDDESVRRLRRHHIVLLAQNEIGRINLYRLISMSNLRFYNRRPQIPKSKLIEHREGLIIGSACEAGELFEAVMNNAGDERITELCNFYDYYEIQPLGNNHFMFDSDKYPNVHNENDLININKKIVELGEKFKKLVVATCDVHFLDPEDKLYRNIILDALKFDDADNQPPLYFRTTNEMLDEFSYLGESKCREVVITNTNKISDMIEKIEPVRPDKCPPVIENSDQDLRDICYAKAKSMYGENLPAVVKDRLDTELDSIINNGYSVMYIIAQKLVKYSVDNGYQVGSRGSVGSSLAATMAGITEVNPLGPHYRCPKCQFSDFDSSIVKKYEAENSCGMDMPDMVCPNCGTPLIKDGFNIPFETFLGFKGDKEPDIDLNFSSEFQSKAHKYTEVIFGKGQTFKAGTVGTIKDKTAYGYVKSFYEKREKRKRPAEIDRIKNGLVGIKRTSGQHPGGIIVLPHGEEIDTFTPIQHPANDFNSDIITTHFDYHSIDHNLLKLDILGHDDPTMIKYLEDYSGVKIDDIPLEDPKALSLFTSTEALGITPDDIHGCKLGCLGIPEFGTENTINMLVEIKPKTLTDLVRISGLSHGEDVWNNNAQDLIKENVADIASVISTRDDIMVYLINHGVDSAAAFDIMEKVRKGKVAKGKVSNWSEMRDVMLENNVPEWYVDSCEKIKYMFPKAHAAAYVMMGIRIAWYKINYPLAYYAAYFGIRAKNFNYDMMCHGLDHVRSEYDRLSKLIETKQITAAEEGSFKTLKLVEEMYARGFEFVPIDLYKAKASKFTIIGNKIMPSFNTIESLGETVAEAMEREAKISKFISQDDIAKRTGAVSKVIEYMESEGIISGLSKSNQISMFDAMQ